MGRFAGSSRLQTIILLMRQTKMASAESLRLRQLTVAKSICRDQNRPVGIADGQW